MKTLGITLIVLFFAINFGFAQSTTNEIEAIKNTFTEINEGTDYEVRELETGCGCGCGGIMAYYKDGELVKIVDYYGHPESSEITEFYYKDGALVFVYDELETFSFDTSQDGDVAGFTDEKYEGRFYFSGGKLIKKDLKGDYEAYVSENIANVLSRISEDNIMLLNGEVTVYNEE